MILRIGIGRIVNICMVYNPMFNFAMVRYPMSCMLKRNDGKWFPVTMVITKPR